MMRSFFSYVSLVFFPQKVLRPNNLTPFKTALSFLGTNHSNFEVICPQNGAAVLQGIYLLIRVFLSEKKKTKSGRGEGLPDTL